MEHKENQELVLIDKIFKALNYTIEDLQNDRIQKAIDMYQTLLKAFQAIKKLNQDKLESQQLLKNKLLEIDQSHEKITQYLKQEDQENALNSLENDVMAKFNELQDFFNHRYYYENYRINVLQKYFKMFKNNGYLDDINDQYVDHTQKYFQKELKSKIDPSLHIAFHKVYQEWENRLIPQNVLNNTLNILNPLVFNGFYSDKNTYDLLITSEHHPKNIVKRVNHQYFDKDNHTISRSKAFKLLFDSNYDVIVKQSYANDGKSVQKLKRHKHKYYLNDKEMNLTEIEKLWGKDFVIQKVLTQHPTMAEPHKYSINTFRMVTLRWNDDIHYLLTYARFGSDYSAKDNGGEGGICVGVSPGGEFKPYGISHDGRVVYEHPTTGYKFSDLGSFPNFDKFIEFVKTLHNRILHHNYVSWDIAVSEEGEPIFIEMNFRGPVWKYQLANGQPIFGEFTEEILQATAKFNEEQAKKKQNK